MRSGKPNSGKSFGRAGRPAAKKGSDRSEGSKRPSKTGFSGEKRSYGSERGGEGYEKKKSYGDKPAFKKSYGDGEKKYGRSSEGFDKKKSFGDKPYKKSFGDSEGKSYARKRSDGDDSGERKYSRGGEGFDKKKSFGDKPYKKSFSDSGERKYSRSSEGFDKKKSFGDKPYKKSFGDSEGKSFARKREGDDSGERKYSRGGEGFDKKKSFGDKPYKKSFGDSERSFGRKRDGEDSGERKYSRSSEGFDKKKSFGDKPYKKSFGDSEGKSFARKRSDGDDSGERKFSRSGEGFDKKKSFGDKPYKKSFGDSERSFGRKRSDGDDLDKKKSFDSEEQDSGRKRSEKGDAFRERKIYGDKTQTKKTDDKPAGKRARKEELDETTRFRKKQSEDLNFDKSMMFVDDHEQGDGEKKAKPKKSTKSADDGTIRLNKYLSNAGISSRREADVLIQTGVVSVNGKIVTELGYKVNPDDNVTYGGVPVKRERKVYLLLNKPKDYITTTDDPQERHTVMELVSDACRERIYPVGRLDRNTTGLLLFTNDGEMATKLMHPKHGIRKVYQVSLSKSFKPEDFKVMLEGLELEDGFIKPDDLAYVGEGGNRKEIGIEVHSGRNRIVRRMFESMGYDVIKLDRVVFAGLTKKDLPRGKWRFLSEKEVKFLRMIG